jgi:hypothetical protein
MTTELSEKYVYCILFYDLDSGFFIGSVTLDSIHIFFEELNIK